MTHTDPGPPPRLQPGSTAPPTALQIGRRWSDRSTPPIERDNPMARRLFTSESVTEGHPDKIADQISDGILEALLAQDPRSRVAVETLSTTGQVHVASEVTTQAYADKIGRASCRERV